jgi:hypothetical protein
MVIHYWVVSTDNLDSSVVPIVVDVAEGSSVVDEELLSVMEVLVDVGMVGNGMHFLLLLHSGNTIKIFST